MLPFEDVSRSPWVLCHSCMIPLMFVQETWIGEENNINKSLRIVVKTQIDWHNNTAKRRTWRRGGDFSCTRGGTTTWWWEPQIRLRAAWAVSAEGWVDWDVREKRISSITTASWWRGWFCVWREERLSGGKAVVPLVEGGRTDGTWIVRHVIMRAHHVQCYKGWLGWGWWVVGNWKWEIGMRGCTRWGTVHMTGNTRWISPIPAPVIEVIGRRHPVFMSFSTLTTWSNGGKCGSMWVMISPNPRYNSGCADNQ